MGSTLSTSLHGDDSAPQGSHMDCHPSGGASNEGRESRGGGSLQDLTAVDREAFLKRYEELQAATVAERAATQAENEPAGEQRVTVAGADSVGDQAKQSERRKDDSCAPSYATFPSPLSSLPSPLLKNKTPGTTTPLQEHKLLGLVLEYVFECSLSSSTSQIANVTVTKNPAFYQTGNVHIDLACLANELDALNANKTESPALSLDDIETIIVRGVQFFMRASSPLYITWLANIFARSDEAFLRGHFPVFKAWKTLGGFAVFDLKAIKESTVRYATVALRCPEFFSAEVFLDAAVPELASPVAAVAQLLIKPPQANTTLRFLVGIFEALEASRSEDLSALITDIITILTVKLSKRTIHYPCFQELTALQMLLSCSSKKVAPLILKHPSFLGPLATAQKTKPGKPSAVSGWALQSESLLGHILRPTALDDVLNTKDGAECCRQRYFFGTLSATADLNASILRLQNQIGDAVSSATSFVTSLCRSGDRQACLKWIALLLTANEKRQQQAVQDDLNLFILSSPSVASVILQVSGLSCTGFNLNVFWMLLKLMEPVTLNKVKDLDPAYVLREESAELLDAFLKESRFGDKEEVEKAHQTLFGPLLENAPPAKFPTQLLFLTLRAAHCLFAPALKEFEELSRRTEELKIAAKGGTEDAQKRYSKAASQVICYTTNLIEPSLMKLWWHFWRLVICWITWLIFAFDEDGRPSEIADDISIDDPQKLAKLLHQAGTDTKASPQFLILPACILETVALATQCFLSYTQSTYPLDEDLFAGFHLFIMRSDKVIRNPHCRWSSGGQTFLTLQLDRTLSRRLDLSPGVIRWAIPCLILSFIDARKTNYYGRIRQHVFHVRQLEQMLDVSAHRDRLKVYVDDQQNQPVFVRFLSMLVESMSWLFEEAVSSLTEIKAKENAGKSGSTQATPGMASQMASSSRPRLDGNLTEDDSDETDEAIDPQNSESGRRSLSSLSFEQLETYCQSVADGGLRAVKVMARVSHICNATIVSSTLLLNQVITSLNCCVEHLVGPRCLQLKVSNFEKYHFDPKQLLASTCEIYVALANVKEKSAVVVAAVTGESRYFKPSVFSKALHIVRREGLIGDKTLLNFDSFVKAVCAKAQEVDIEEQWLAEIWDDIPDSYKDPIMDDLMEDPVQLPTSGKIMDRKNIERHLLTEEFDPFNRMPLKPSDLIPVETLRQEITQYIQEKKQQRQKDQES